MTDNVNAKKTLSRVEKNVEKQKNKNNGFIRGTCFVGIQVARGVLQGWGRDIYANLFPDFFK